IAIANAKIAYARFEEIFSGDRWERLASGGAHEQRPLWASTGTKNPSYPDTLYVDSLIGPRTVNTVPPATLTAFLDHGATEETLRLQRDAARRELEQLARHGIRLEEVAAQLQAEGLEAFDRAFHALLDGISAKATQLGGRWFPSKPQLGEIDRSVEEALQEIHARKVVSRIWAHDHTVWSDSEREISDRLGWLHVADAMKKALRALDRFAAEVHEEGYRDALLLGMGGSSLAPEVFAKVFGPLASGGLSLTVLDTTDPEPIQSCTERLDPTRTLVIVSTKSGTTEETLSLLRHFYQWKRRSLGKGRTGEGMVAITDPGSPLQRLAEAYGFRRTFLNDPTIGGRYAALSHVGLVPAALTGMEVGRLLDRARAMADECHAQEENDAAWLGAVLAACAAQGRDKVTFSATGAIAPFLDWVEQLIAESTGKRGQGILPVVGEPMVGSDLYGDDRIFVDLRLFGDSSDNESLRTLRKAGHPVIQRWFADRYDLGREFFLWEFATAMAGHRLGIHPFNQPDVEAAKARAREAVQAYRQSGRLPEDPAHRPSGDALPTFLRQAKPGDYVALQAYVAPREDVDAALQQLRATILGTYPVATTVGYGPRFLHSTGQLHKGDGGNGLFVQIVSDAVQDLPIPDGMEDSASSITFGT
ncbi:MAG TPA: bifunctional transaldolase/phosoglucose isomerase, partial [Candidatus Acetothermia bacterium]|nr:bifunctional transaldolase/phosoglucose isomerase [Candidatus Acetothermia bacterium]